jgi:hypothetical protein
MRSAGYEDASANAKFGSKSEIVEQGIRMALPLADTGVALQPDSGGYHDLDESAEGLSLRSLFPLPDDRYWLRIHLKTTKIHCALHCTLAI